MLALLLAVLAVAPVVPPIPAAAPALSYDFGNPGVLPFCQSNPDCVAICTPNAGGTAWQCLDNTGAAFGTITQGTGTTYQSTPFGTAKAMSDVTSAKAPYVVSTTLDSLFKADHTIVMAGYGTTLTDINFQHFSGIFDGTNFFTARNDSGIFHCIWNGAGGTADANTTGPYLPVNGWAVTSCRQSGTDHYARVNSSDSLTANHAAVTGNLTAGFGLYMGDRWTAGLPLRGPLAFVAIFSAALSSAQLGVIERGWWGLPEGLTAPVGTGVQGLDNTATSGQVDMYLLGSSMVNSHGLRATGYATTSFWAADQLDASSWTAVGTPTTTTNVSAGPFFRWRNTNECDLVVDDDAAAFEGYQSTGNAFTVNKKYTASCYLKAGTSGVSTTKARLVVTTDGTGSATCDFTDLTSTTKRKSCTATIGGAPTFVRGQVLVGNAAADTGSVTVCQCQLNSSGWVETPTVDNVLKGSGSAVVSTAPWPNATLGGKYEVVFEPIHNANTDWSVQADTLYLMDTYVGTNHAIIDLFGYNSAGNSMARFANLMPGGITQQTEFDSGGGTLTLSPGTLSATSLEWRPQANGRCNEWQRYNTCAGTSLACAASRVIGSVTNGTGWCPMSPTSAKLADRYDGSVPTSVFIKSFRVYR